MNFSILKKISFKITIIVIILLFIFLSNISISRGDTLIVDDFFAIGLIDVNCNDYYLEGFCTNFYNKKIEDNYTRLFLFDMTPNEKICKINCTILNFKVFDRRGNKLKGTIISDNAVIPHMLNIFYLFFISIIIILISIVIVSKTKKEKIKRSNIRKIRRKTK